MPPAIDEAIEWLDRAEQAREVAGQLTDPDARRAVLQFAEEFDRLARATAGLRPHSRPLPAPISTPPSSDS